MSNTNDTRTVHMDSDGWDLVIEALEEMQGTYLDMAADAEARGDIGDVAPDTERADECGRTIEVIREQVLHQQAGPGVLTSANPRGLDLASLEKITGTAWHWEVLDFDTAEQFVWTRVKCGPMGDPDNTYAVIRYEPGVWDDMLMESFNDDTAQGHGDQWPEPYTAGAYPWTLYYAFTKPCTLSTGRNIARSFHVDSFNAGKHWEAEHHGPTPEYVAQVLAYQQSRID